MMSMAEITGVLKEVQQTYEDMKKEEYKKYFDNRTREELCSDYLIMDDKQLINHYVALNHSLATRLTNESEEDDDTEECLKNNKKEEYHVSVKSKGINMWVCLETIEANSPREAALLFFLNQNIASDVFVSAHNGATPIIKNDHDNIITLLIHDKNTKRQSFFDFRKKPNDTYEIITSKTNI